MNKLVFDLYISYQHKIGNINLSTNKMLIILLMPNNLKIVYDKNTAYRV